MITLTRPQRRALYRKWRENDQGMTYRQFRRTVTPGWDYVAVAWCGMYVGIEKDGYAHT